jgi:hypothetical protein
MKASVAGSALARTSISLPQSDLDQIQQEADRAGMTVSYYLRHLAINAGAIKMFSGEGEANCSLGGKCKSSAELIRVLADVQARMSVDVKLLEQEPPSEDGSVTFRIYCLLENRNRLNEALQKLENSGIEITSIHWEESRKSS